MGLARPDAGTPADSRVACVLISEEEILAGVTRIAREIANDYEGREITLVPVLSGSIVFLADLIRRLPLRMRIHPIAASSYGSGTSSSGAVEVLEGLGFDVDGRDILIVDDILDTGRTLERILSLVREAGARSIRTCVLLDKPSRREVEVRADYRAFQIGNEFVVGYGLDLDGLYRNLPYIATLDPG